MVCFHLPFPEVGLSPRATVIAWIHRPFFALFPSFVFRPKDTMYVCKYVLYLLSKKQGGMSSDTYHMPIIIYKDLSSYVLLSPFLRLTIHRNGPRD